MQSVKLINIHCGALGGSHRWFITYTVVEYLYIYISSDTLLQTL